MHTCHMSMFTELEHAVACGKQRYTTSFQLHLLSTQTSMSLFPLPRCFLSSKHRISRTVLQDLRLPKSSHPGASVRLEPGGARDATFPSTSSQKHAPEFAAGGEPQRRGQPLGEVPSRAQAPQPEEDAPLAARGLPEPPGPAGSGVSARLVSAHVTRGAHMTRPWAGAGNTGAERAKSYRRPLKAPKAKRPCRSGQPVAQGDSWGPRRLHQPGSQGAGRRCPLAPPPSGPPSPAVMPLHPRAAPCSFPSPPSFLLSCLPPKLSVHCGRCH